METRKEEIAGVRKQEKKAEEGIKEDEKGKINDRIKKERNIKKTKRK